MEFSRPMRECPTVTALLSFSRHSHSAHSRPFHQDHTDGKTMGFGANTLGFKPESHYVCTKRSLPTRDLGPGKAPSTQRFLSICGVPGTVPCEAAARSAGGSQAQRHEIHPNTYTRTIAPDAPHSLQMLLKTKTKTQR